jgi:endonuclease YncB( thermonuclease family)
MSPSAQGKIVRVIDGDTIVIAFRVRSRGGNAPELRTAAGQAAKAATERQWPKGKAVAAEVFAVDAYGRLLATLAPA